MTSSEECTACYTPVAKSADCERVRFRGRHYILCASCWAKVAREGRTPRQVVEAVCLFYTDEFDGPDCRCGHEDYRDLERLGFWSADQGKL